MKRQGAGGDALGQDGVVRLRGLPYEADMDALKEFFTGYDIIDNGIYIQLDAMGRSAGEAYVQFASQKHADAALAKDHEKMGHRYIEIFKSSLAELRAKQGGGAKPLMPRGGMRGGGRPTPYDRGDRFMGA